MLLANMCFPLLSYSHVLSTVADKMVVALVSYTRTNLPTAYYTSYSIFALMPVACGNIFLIKSDLERLRHITSYELVRGGYTNISFFSKLTSPVSFCLIYHFWRGFASTPLLTSFKVLSVKPEFLEQSSLNS